MRRPAPGLSISALTALTTMAPTLLLAAVAWAQPESSERRPAAPDAEVDILNPNGSTRIIGWDRPEVAVTGRGGRRPDMVVSGEGGKIKIRPGDPEHGMGGGSTIEVRVPRMSRVKMKSFNARITAENLGGSLKAESFEGSLSVTRGPAEIVLKSTSGSVEVQANATRVEVESVNGSITVRDVGGQLKARTVNGSISVEGRRFDEVKLSSVSGRVRFEGDVSPKARVEAKSVNGSVELRLPSNTSGNFVLGSANGRLSSDFAPGRGEGGDEGSGERKWSFSIGGNEARIEARSVNGSVGINKR
jgi:Putative adhesin